MRVWACQLLAGSMEALNWGGLSSLGLHREIQSKKINKVNFLIA